VREYVRACVRVIWYGMVWYDVCVYVCAVRAHTCVNVCARAHVRDLIIVRYTHIPSMIKTQYISADIFVVGNTRQ
jgi:hypothetical protein